MPAASSRAEPRLYVTIAAFASQLPLVQSPGETRVPSGTYIHFFLRMKR
jgi:hypothetical protein